MRFCVFMDLEKIVKRAPDTKRLEIGEGILPVTATVFAESFPGKRPIIVIDSRNWESLGVRLQFILIRADLHPEPPIILASKGLVADWEHVEELDRLLSQTDAIPIAVGGGTINDLTKLCSEHCGRRYISVAQMASMDGYASYGASILKDGVKQAFSCRAPYAIIADTEIIAGAPAHVTASGYADLFAKITAGADWMLADALGVEKMDQFAFQIVQDGLKVALNDAEGVKRADRYAIQNLIDGLLMSGFAMQAYQSSRPASGSEHQFSHLLNMENHTMADGRVPSHGYQVGVGLMAATALYEKLLKEDFSKLDVEKCVAAWPSLEAQQAEAAKLFPNPELAKTIQAVIAKKYRSKDELRRELTALKENWPELRQRLRKQLVPLKKVRRQLKAVGAPTTPEEIGLTREEFQRALVKSEMVRDRFCIFDLAHHLGKLKEWSQQCEL